jgi:hypothetical protein
MQKTKETKKVVETKYTADELVKIGNLLRHGDAMRIAEQCEMPYNSVARLFSGGEHNIGITNRATKSLLVIEKALAIIATYKVEAMDKKNALDMMIKKYDMVLCMTHTENLAY